MNLKLKYKVGQKICVGDHIMTVIGHEYVEGRNLRFILLSILDNKTDWLYLYEFEILALKTK